jgi:hypothetical protein
VLRVISSSPGELEPVFSAMLENALGICEAKFGMLLRYSDGAFVAQAMVGAPPALVDALMRKPFTPPSGIPLDRMLRARGFCFDTAVPAAPPAFFIFYVGAFWYQLARRKFSLASGRLSVLRCRQARLL